MSGKPTLLVTGASGLLGWNLYHFAQGRYDTYGTYHTISVPGDRARLIRLDLLAGTDLEKLVDRLKPDVVVHTAAMTRTGECESRRGQTRAVNTDATRRLAAACAANGARLIHLSTDLVFDGRKGRPYVEDDPVRPVSYYGYTKALAEEAIPKVTSNYAILRGALMYGRSMTGDRGAAEWVVNTVRDTGSVNLFTDEYRTPILIEDLCEAILRMAESTATGIFHAAGPERITRYDFGVRLAGVAGLAADKIVGSSLRRFAGHPPRTPDVSMDSTKLTTLLGLRLLDVNAGLARLYPSASSGSRVLSADYTDSRRFPERKTWIKR